MPGAAVKCACVYERALTWALEAERLDLPRLSMQCQRFIIMHWEHIGKYALLYESLSGPARARIMKFQTLKPAIRGPSYVGLGRRPRRVNGAPPPVPYPTKEEFMSWILPCEMP